MNRWMIIFHWGWCCCWWTRCLIWRREISGCAETSKTSCSSSSKPRMETPLTGATHTHTMSHMRLHSCCLFKAELMFLLHCRKIVDHVDYMTSPEQVSDYVKRFRWWFQAHCVCFDMYWFWFVFWLGFLTLAETLTGQMGSSPRRRPAETKAYAWGRESPPRPHSWASCQVHTHTLQPESSDTEHANIYVHSQHRL